MTSQPRIIRDALPAAISGNVIAARRSRSASTSSMGRRATRAADTVALTSDSNSAITAAFARPVVAKNTNTDLTRSRHSEYGVSDVNEPPGVGMHGTIHGLTPLHPHRTSLPDTPRNPNQWHPYRQGHGMMSGIRIAGCGRCATVRVARCVRPARRPDGFGLVVGSWLWVFGPRSLVVGLKLSAAVRNQRPITNDQRPITNDQ